MTPTSGPNRILRRSPRCACIRTRWFFVPLACQIDCNVINTMRSGLMQRDLVSWLDETLTLS